MRDHGSVIWKRNLIVPVLLLLVVGGCAQPSSQLVQGRVVSDPVSVQIQAGPAQVVETFVAPGASVKKGDVLVRLDVRIAQLERQDALAERALALAEMGVLESRLIELSKNRSKALDAKKTIEEALHKADQARKSLTKKQTQLQQALAVAPEPAKPQILAGLKKIHQALGNIDRGTKSMKQKLNEIGDALTKMEVARRALSGAKDVTETVADGLEVGVEVADYFVKQNTVTAPTSGSIVSVVPQGSVIGVGGEAVEIREAGRSEIVAWVPLANISQTCVGGGAQIGVHRGFVTQIAPKAEFPPTRYSTTENHLTRTVEIRIQTEDLLPAGATVAVQFENCQTGESRP